MKKILLLVPVLALTLCAAATAFAQASGTPPTKPTGKPPSGPPPSGMPKPPKPPKV